MSRPERQKAPLEPLVAMPNGALAPRCQAVSSRTGQQCRRAARHGFRVCSTHGAGTRAREERGERRSTGRPPTHGLYSRRGLTNIRALMEEVRALEHDLDDTDHEMVTLKAVLWHLLEQAERFEGHAATIEAAVGAVEAALAAAERGEDGAPVLAAVEARAVARELARGHRFLSQLEGYAMRLSEAAVRVVTMAKARAETRAKLAETRALEHFIRLVVATRNVVWDILPDAELVAVFEDRMRREILGPARLELPPPDPGAG